MWQVGKSINPPEETLYTSSPVPRLLNGPNKLNIPQNILNVAPKLEMGNSYNLPWKGKLSFCLWKREEMLSEPEDGFAHHFLED